MTSRLLARLRLFVRRSSATREFAPACSRRRAARAAVVSGIVAFLTATVGLAVAVETVVPEWRDPEFGHRLTLLRRAERESSGRPLVVVIGTSRAQTGICPRAMGFGDAPDAPRVFNLGQSGSTPLKELLTLRRLLDAGVRPAAVVIEVFPPLMMSSAPAERQPVLHVARLSAADLRHLEPYAADAGAMRLAWLKRRANPWCTHRQVLMNHWLPRWQPWPERFEFHWTSLDADGFQSVPESTAAGRAQAVAVARSEYAAAFAGFAPAAESVRAVGELVALCRDEGIRVAIYTPPLSPAFRASFAPGVYEAGEAYLFELARRLGVDVFPAPPDMTEDEFLDGHHATRRGAERYSRWLADNHLRPWLAKSGMGGAP